MRKHVAKLAGFPRGEQGMAMISSLLLLLVISLLAVGLSMDSSMDVRGAGYQRSIARAFSSTEAGLMASTDILEDNIDAGGWDLGGIPTLNSNYHGTIEIFENGDFSMEKNKDELLIMRMTGDIEADVTTQYLDSTLAQGGAIQVAAGYSGTGKGLGAGGAYVYFNFQVRGFDVAGDVENSARNLGASYVFVTK